MLSKMIPASRAGRRAALVGGGAARRAPAQARVNAGAARSVVAGPGAPPMARGGPLPRAVLRPLGARAGSTVSAPLAPEPPFKTVIIYNQSKHASQSVLADIRAVWGTRVRVIETIEEGLQRLPGVDASL